VVTHLIDAHAHIGESLFGYSCSVEALLGSMDAEDIERSVVVALKPRDYHFSPENDRVANAVATHEDRLSGFVRVDPWQREAALGELRRGLDDLNLIGLYLHPFEEQFAANDELIFPLMNGLRERGLPLMIAGGYPTFAHPSQIGDLARQFPEVTIIVTHGGQLNISGLLLGDAAAMLRGNPNVIMETSGIYREDFIEDTISELGADRVVFGSNAPYLDQGFEADRIRYAHVDVATKNRIGRANIAQICSLPSRAH
jgi:uncharacterized protein